MKKILCIAAVFAFLFLLAVPVSAESKTPSESSTYSDYYKEQLKKSGAVKLKEKLPNDTQNSLEDLGVNGTDINEITSVSPQNYFQKAINIFTDKFKKPFLIFCKVITVILLCALLNGMKLSFGEKPLGGIIGMVGTLCICTVVVTPLIACIQDAANVLKGSSDFLLACIPVITGIMVAAGQPAEASSYNILMLTAGNAVSVLAADFLVPMLNILLALSVVSSVSPGIKLSGLCSALNKAVKWIIGFCMTLFTSLVTMHSIVASSIDRTGSKAVKFVVSSFVPVVGNALGEAMNTVNGCVKMLKSGVCAFGLLAGIFIFLPVVIECILWVITLNICSGIGQMFELDEVTSLLKSSADVTSTILAVLLCSITVLIICTAIMLIIGGAA